MKNIILALAILYASGVAYANDLPAQTDTIKVGDSSEDAFQTDMHQKFRDIFSSFFNHAFDSTDPNQKNFMPIRSLGSSISARSELYETKDDIIVTVDMPGAKKENIDVQVAPRVIAISYQQKEETSTKDDAASIREARYASFSRQYALPDYAKLDDAEADYKDGVLTITIPKGEKLVIKPRKLEVN